VKEANVVPAPDAINLRDFNRYIRAFRAFLGQNAIAAAESRIQLLLRSGNPFRKVALAEKQPWPNTFRDFDKATFNGARKLPVGRLTEDLVEAACGFRRS